MTLISMSFAQLFPQLCGLAVCFLFISSVVKGGNVLPLTGRSLKSDDSGLESMPSNGDSETMKSKPNIVFFLTDDWGMNDVGYYGNTDTQTPFIDSMALYESLIIGKHYAMPLCSASRAALLTGRYPMRYGLQSEIIFQTSNFALSKHETIISNEFQDQGYSTHLVGKWHQGFMSWEYTPTFRGFDTFMGFYGGDLDYFDHSTSESGVSGNDFRMQLNEYDQPQRYTLYIYAEQVQARLDELARSSQDGEPFFIYVGWQGSHIPSQAPDDYLSMYIDDDSDSDDYNEKRVNFQAQTSMTDQLFKTIVDDLKRSGLWENTLLVFASDNGADKASGDNTPFRGSKGTLFEGGVRVPAFITGGYLDDNLRGKMFDKYPFHITDWYPTLLDIAGLKVTSKNKLDGENMWQVIQSNSVSNEALLKISSKIENKNDKNSNNEKNNENDENDDDEKSVLSKTSERIMLLNVNSDNCNNDEACGSLIYGGRWKVVTKTEKVSDWTREFAATTNGDAFGCGEVPSSIDTSVNECENSVCLFDLLNDPCEYYDVSDDYPELTRQLYSKLIEFYNEQSLPLYSNMGYVDDASKLVSDSGYWTPWEDLSNYENGWKDLEFESMLEPFYTYENENENESKSESMLEITIVKVNRFRFNNTIDVIACLFGGVIFMSLLIYCIARHFRQKSWMKRKFYQSDKLMQVDESSVLLRNLGNKNEECDQYTYTFTL